MPPAAGHRLPISVKAVLVERGRAFLLLNERDQWELPGGRLEAGEEPEECLEREVREETGMAVEIETLVDARVLRAPPDKELLVVVYRCRRQRGERPRLSPEHRQAGWFGLARAESLTLPPGTLRSLRRALDSGT